MNTSAAACWRVIAASAPGVSNHVGANTRVRPHMDTGGQDAYAYRVLPGGELLAAVSDGAGTAAHSQEGACLAVEWALAGLEALWQRCPPDDEAGWQAAITGLYAEIHQKLVDFAEAAGAPLRAYAATLTCALAADEWLVVGQIGDGAAVAETLDGSLFLAARPQRSEYANETYFLTLPEAVRYTVVYAALQPVQALALTTDGLLRLALKLPEYEPLPKFFHPLFSFAREAADEVRAQAELADFLASERVCSRTDDDKTLLLAVHPGLQTLGG